MVTEDLYKKVALSDVIHYKNSMNISVVLFAVGLTAFLVESKTDRLNLFRKHHETRPKSNISTRFTVRQNVCNTKTCIKCKTLLTYNNTGMTQLKAGCRKLVAMRNCCSATSLLTNHLF